MTYLENIDKNKCDLVLENCILNIVFPSGYNRILLEDVRDFSIKDKKKQIYEVVYNNGQKTIIHILRKSIGSFFNEPYYRKNLRSPKNLDFLSKLNSKSIIASVEYIETTKHGKSKINLVVYFPSKGSKKIVSEPVDIDMSKYFDTTNEDLFGTLKN